MNTISASNLLAQLNWRYATKQFDPARKISPADWQALEEALLLSPSSCGLQPWGFVVVENPALREQLLPASWGQRQIVDASHLVVFAIRRQIGEAEVDACINRIAQVRGVTPASLEGFRGMIIGTVITGMDAAARKHWEIRQLYIALGVFLASAAVLGIDACPMEGIDPAQYDKILGMEAKGLSTVVVATAGYRAAADKYAAAKKVRFEKSQVVLHV